MEAWEVNSILNQTQTELILVSEKLSTVSIEVENKNWFGHVLDKINDILDNVAEIVLHIIDPMSHPEGYKLKGIYKLINDILEKMTILNGFRYFAGS